MTAPLLEMFRTLTSFSPPRGSMAKAPWEDFVDWSIAQGLGPLVAYNLEYRLAGGGAPDWARDRLLSVYQGSLSDNVMKLVNFKRVVDDLEGRRILFLGGSAFAEALYPHVAFRPVLDLEVAVLPADLDGFVGYLGQHQFRPMKKDDVGPHPYAAALTDTRTRLFIATHPFGANFSDLNAGMFSRALPMKVYGKSVFRPDLEDAILTVCLEQARAGFQVPYLSFVDFRELIGGATSIGGPYARKPDTAALIARAQESKLDRALYVSCAITQGLYPDVAPAAQAAMPPLRQATRLLLDRAIVAPALKLGQMTVLKGVDRLRRLLSGGR